MTIDLSAMLTPKQLADYLGLSERTVWTLLKTGEIPSYHYSRKRLVDPHDVETYLGRHRITAG